MRELLHLGLAIFCGLHVGCEGCEPTPLAFDSRQASDAPAADTARRDSQRRDAATPRVKVVWYLQEGSSSYDEGRGVGVDGAGNVYTTGIFSGSIALGGTPLGSKGSSDVFLGSLTASAARAASVMAVAAAGRAAPAAALGGAEPGAFTPGRWGSTPYDRESRGGPLPGFATASSRSRPPRSAPEQTGAGSDSVCNALSATERLTSCVITA
jgi:hypothetical protein